MGVPHVKLAVIVATVMSIFGTAQLTDKTHKSVTIEQIVHKMELITKAVLRTNNIYSIKPNYLLEHLSRMLWRSVGARDNSKAYVDIIMRGFKIMLVKNSDVGEIKYGRTNGNMHANLTVFGKVQNKGRLRYKRGPKLPELDEIMKHLKKFAITYSVPMEEAIEILKYKLSIAADEKIMAVMPAYHDGNTVSPFNDNSIEEELNHSLRKNVPNFKQTDTSQTTGSNCLAKNCICQKVQSQSRDCNEFCQVICTHTLHLQRHLCHSINGTESISLDLLCNGIVDCDDESDETDCNYNSDKNLNFEANKIFKVLLEPSTNDKEHAYFLVKLHDLYNKLNTNQLASKGDDQILALRNALIEELVSIYSVIIRDMVAKEKIDKVYESLSRTKSEVIKGLKLSATGNRRLVPQGKCFCREEVCAVPECPKQCHDVCSTLPLLARYSCKNTATQDNSIPMKTLCDGKIDCPKADDEVNCKKEPCRSHHLIMLRRRLQDILPKYKGTRINEIIRTWLSKVIESLTRVESGNNDKRQAFQDITSDAFTDLIVEYKKLQSSRRIADNQSRGDDFPTFYQAAQLIVEAKMYCGV